MSSLGFSQKLFSKRSFSFLNKAFLYSLSFSFSLFGVFVFLWALNGGRGAKIDTARAVPFENFSPPPIYYEHYDWRNQDFRQTAPNLGPMGSMMTFAWNDIHKGSGQFDFKIIDDYLSLIENKQMMVTVGGKTIFKPVILAITSYLSDYVDYTPGFVKEVAKSYTLSPGGTCVARVAPRYDDPFWLSNYKEMVTALGQRYNDLRYPSGQKKVAAIEFGLGIDDEFGMDTKNKGSCNYRAALQAQLPYNKYLSLMLPTGPNGGIISWYASAFPTTPLYVSVTSDGKRVVDQFMAPNIYGRPIGLRQASLTEDSNNWIQSNGWGIFDLAYRYRDTSPIAFENANGYNGPNPASRQRRYLTLLAGLTARPDYVEFLHPWVVEINNDLQLAADFKARQRFLGKKIADSDEVWIALRDTDFFPRKYGSVVFGGLQGDFSYGLTRMEVLDGDKTSVLGDTQDDGATAPRNPALPLPSKDHLWGFRARTNFLGNRYIRLRVDDAWDSGFRLQFMPSYVVTLRFVNKGTDTLSVRYMKSDSTEGIVTIQKGSGLGSVDDFVEQSLVLSDAVFNHGLGGGSDLVVDANDDGAEIVEMVSLSRLYKPLKASSSDPIVFPPVEN